MQLRMRFFPGTGASSSVKNYQSYTYSQLAWKRFTRHKLAVFSAIVLIFIYLGGIFAEFIAPYSTSTYNPNYQFHPPHQIFIGEGLYLYVLEMEKTLDLTTFQNIYEPTGNKLIVRFFVEGEPYRMWGLIESNIHLFGVDEGAIFLMGADELGRDMFSRVLFGARISTTIGLVGVFLSAVIGISLGGIAGLVGGTIDNIVQRLIEVIRSIPTLPLWMGLAAALPADLSPVASFFLISILLSVVGWTSVARVTRSAFLSIGKEDYITAAKLTGIGNARIIMRYMIPNFLSYIIAELTLGVPRMIIGETALSFIGIGLREPVVSWGVLLQKAQSIAVISLSPWLLWPAILVVITVLAFNFVGDGMRDAADPYTKSKR